MASVHTAAGGIMAELRDYIHPHVFVPHYAPSQKRSTMAKK